MNGLHAFHVYSGPGIASRMCCWRISGKTTCVVSLTFIDKARAVHDAKLLLGTELGLKEVSLRRLETELRDAGYRISNTGICLMRYAVERLLILIPQALEAGHG